MLHACHIRHTSSVHPQNRVHPCPRSRQRMAILKTGSPRVWPAHRWTSACWMPTPAPQPIGNGRSAAHGRPGHHGFARHGHRRCRLVLALRGLAAQPGRAGSAPAGHLLWPPVAGPGPGWAGRPAPAGLELGTVPVDAQRAALDPLWHDLRPLSGPCRALPVGTPPACWCPGAGSQPARTPPRLSLGAHAWGVQFHPNSMRW
jgi:hypothetical protein